MDLNEYKIKKLQEENKILKAKYERLKLILVKLKEQIEISEVVNN